MTCSTWLTQLDFSSQPSQQKKTYFTAENEPRQREEKKNSFFFKIVNEARNEREREFFPPPLWLLLLSGSRHEKQVFSCSVLWLFLCLSIIFHSLAHCSMTMMMMMKIKFRLFQGNIYCICTLRCFCSMVEVNRRTRREKWRQKIGFYISLNFDFYVFQEVFLFFFFLLFLLFVSLPFAYNRCLLFR